MVTRFYVASAMPTGYPYKLQKPSTVSNRVRDTAESFILDSGIGDDVTNAEVLDLAHQYDAEYVIGKDYLHDQDRTTDSVREFFDLYDGHACDAVPMVPLQPPFADHYHDLAGYDHYVLGGMAVDEVSNADKIRWIRDFRDVAPDVYAHGLGVGGSIEFVEVAGRENLLDSIDCSTPEQAGMHGSVLGDDLRRTDAMVFPGGDGRCKRTYPLAEFNCWQVQDVWDRECAKQPDARTQTSLPYEP